MTIQQLLPYSVKLIGNLSILGQICTQLHTTDRLLAFIHMYIYIFFFCVSTSFISFKFTLNVTLQNKSTDPKLCDNQNNYNALFPCLCPLFLCANV